MSFMRLLLSVQITREFEERHQAKTVVEMKQFVQKLPRIQVAKQSLALRESLGDTSKHV